jgi:hypothetical protein
MLLLLLLLLVMVLLLLLLLQLTVPSPLWRSPPVCPPLIPWLQSSPQPTQQSQHGRHTWDKPSGCSSSTAAAAAAAVVLLVGCSCRGWLWSAICM